MPNPIIDRLHEVAAKAKQVLGRGTQLAEDLYENETVYGRTEGRRERVCVTSGLAVCG